MAKQATFEQALKTLEDAVSRLEKGQLPLDEALGCFEQGVNSAGRCRELLRDVETRVEVLLKDAGGALRVEPFETDDEADDDEE
jgi:exodeoxyribonuclease VII small subunit